MPPGIIGASRVMLVVKNLPASGGDISDVGLIPGSGRSPAEGHFNPPVFLPGEPQGQRRLVGSRPGGL